MAWRQRACGVQRPPAGGEVHGFDREALATAVAERVGRPLGNADDFGELLGCARDRGIDTVAMDMPTINPGEYIKAHHLLLGAGMLVIEGLARLDQLTARDIFLIALPLRLRGRDGSPCRVVAIDGQENGSLLATLGSAFA